jgi:hypothetical protein
MFFRRPKPHQPTLEERLQTLRDRGFKVDREADGRVRVSRNGCAALVRDGRIEHAGWVVGGDIAALVDAGFQKFWRVGKERRAPALAAQLQALHDFEGDLREGLGVPSLFNMSLGTRNDLHIYDRVEGRESS